MKSFVLRRRRATSAEALRNSSLPLTETRRRNTNRDETGASLLLALIFLTVISVTVASLLGLIRGGLTDSIAFKQARTTESAANSTAELALQYVRYNFFANTVDSPNPQTCITSLPGLLNLPPMQAFCRTSWSETSGSRTVTVSVCRNGVDSLTCENQPLLQAVVQFNDNSVSSKDNCTPVSVQTTGTTCGSGLQVVSWVIDPVPPTVTNVVVSSTVSGCPLGEGLIITGTGFMYTNSRAPVVTFVLNPATFSSTTSPGTPTVLSDSTIEACSPAGTAASANLPITVTTPSGISAYNSGSQNVY
jgi:hypothetical protein